MRFSARSAAFAALLVATTALLAGCGTSVSLDEPIEARTWRLTTLNEQEVIWGGDPQRDPQLRFDGTRVSGFGGCNQLSGPYQRAGGTLKLGPLASTRMACADQGRTALEINFLTALQATTGYSKAGRLLTLTDSGGRTLAVLDSGR
jgi:heat shock protein HslJ